MYTEENTPAWIHVLRQKDEWPYVLELTLEAYDSIRVKLFNIKFFHIDLVRALLDTGLTVADVNAIIGFMQYGAKYVTFTIDGHGTVYGEIVLPQGIKVVRVRNSRGEIIKHTVNNVNNAVSFMVELGSAESLVMTVASVTTTVTQITPVITSLVVAVAASMYIVRMVTSEVRKWLA